MTKKREPETAPTSEPQAAPGPLTETAPEPPQGGVYVDGKRVEGPDLEE